MGIASCLIVLTGLLLLYNWLTSDQRILNSTWKYNGGHHIDGGDFIEFEKSIYSIDKDTLKRNDEKIGVFTHRSWNGFRIRWSDNDSESVYTILGTKDGLCIQNEDQAIEKAASIFVRTYGEQVLEQKPFKAQLIEKGMWEVRGTFHQPADRRKIRHGGVAEILINASDCKVLHMTHGK